MSLLWESVPGLAVRLYETHRDELMTQGWRSPLVEKLAGESPAAGLPSLPGPLLASLLGGLGVGSAGYLLGSGLEPLMPRDWKRGRLRRTLGLGGLAAGAMPGLIYGLSNLAAGRPYNTNVLRPGMQLEPPRVHQPADWKLPSRQPPVDGPAPELLQQTAKLAWEKMAANESATGLGAFRPIDVNEFNQVIWKDPRVAVPLTPAMQAAATGAVTSAAYLPGKENHDWVSPLDLGRLAVGMGGGYLSGAIAGSVLGALIGLPAETQDRLKQTGLWAGAVKTVIPRLFGG